MRYLLDTHTFLWSIFDPRKLPNKVIKTIEKNENEIFVSTISFWEISLKYNLGKINLQKVIPDELPYYAAQSGFEIINIDEKIVSSFYRLKKYEHCDPFDRMLIWQAINEDLIMISKDEMFNEYKKDGLILFW